MQTPCRRRSINPSLGRDLHSRKGVCVIRLLFPSTGASPHPRSDPGGEAGRGLCGARTRPAGPVLVPVAGRLLTHPPTHSPAPPQGLRTGVCLRDNSRDSMLAPGHRRCGQVAREVEDQASELFGTGLPTRPAGPNSGHGVSVFCGFSWPELHPMFPTAPRTLMWGQARPRWLVAENQIRARGLRTQKFHGSPN